MLRPKVYPWAQHFFILKISAKPRKYAFIFSLFPYAHKHTFGRSRRLRNSVNGGRADEKPLLEVGSVKRGMKDKNFEEVCVYEEKVAF